MAKAFSCRRRFFAIGTMALLAGGLVAIYLHTRDTAPIELFQPWIGNPAIQLEPPPEEIGAGPDRILAKQFGDSDWVFHGDAGSIPLLLTCLKSQDEIVQLAALAEFAGMGAKARGAVPAIVEALQDEKSLIRLKAAVTLIQLNCQTKAAVSAIAKEIRSENVPVRVRAAEAIEQLIHPQREVASCWGPEPPPQIARPWVRKAVQNAIKLDDRE